MEEFILDQCLGDFDAGHEYEEDDDDSILEEHYSSSMLDGEDDCEYSSSGILEPQDECEYELLDEGDIIDDGSNSDDHDHFMLDEDIVLGSSAVGSRNPLLHDVLPSVVDDSHICRFERPVLRESLSSKVNAVCQDHPTEDAIVLVERVFERIVDSLHVGQGLTLTICRKPTSNRTVSSTDSQRISFPGKTSEEAWRFTVFVRVLELIHEALSRNTIVTKRDIFYRDVKLFVQQRVVDRCVDDIARTFRLPRASLNVVAAPKGLFAGNFSIIKQNKSPEDISNEREGTLIPNFVEGDNVNTSLLRWILIVEKEAVFNTLTKSPFSQHLLSQGALLTGKGYPDVATRHAAHLLSIASSSIPVFGLTDYDPDGLAILSTYKHGSAALAHQNLTLTVPRIQRLGLGSAEVGNVVDESDLHQSQGLLPLTVRDRRRATKMLGWARLDEHGMELEWRRELQVMLMLNIKAELQLLDALEGGIAKWIMDRICSD